MQEKIKIQMTDAMRARDALRVSVLRGMMAAFTNELVAKGKKPVDPLSDEDCLAVIKRLTKQRKDSIEQFGKGGRQDLVEKETAELKILEEYLPAQIPKEEIFKVAKQVQKKMGMTDPTKKGVLMGAILKELKGQADGSTVKEVVDSLFS
ncbi:MAG: GatB/YqeY domain-containing protein [Patescibacteria group bacterium]